MSSIMKQAIQSLKARVADAYTAVATKGGTLPATQDSANLPAAIASIPSGSDGSEIWAALTYGYLSFQNSTVEFEVHAGQGIPASTLANCFKSSYVTKADIASVASSSLEGMFQNTSKITYIRISSLPTTITSLKSFAYGSAATSIYLYGNCPNCTALNTVFAANTNLIDCTMPSIGSTTKTAQGYLTFSGCTNLQRLTIYNSGTVYLNYCYNMFQNCSNLAEIDGVLDISASSTNGNIFAGCAKLESVYIKGAQSSLSVSPCPLLTYASLLYLVQNVQSVSNQTLTLGSTNLAKLNATAEGQAAIAAAQANGWTIA